MRLASSRCPCYIQPGAAHSVALHAMRVQLNPVHHQGPKKPMTDITTEQIDIREKLAHIDQMLADHDRKRQEIRLTPWQLALTGMASGAAAFAAGAAFIKLLG